MQFDNQVVVNAVRASLDQNRGRGRVGAATEVCADCSLGCWSGNRHAGSGVDGEYDGWVEPFVAIERECRCVCHESVPRAPYVEVWQECAEGMK
ncbi:hypothetical protein [Amycolatopsis sp. NPDC004079]|uniref:hypothetical protein n=1 Tax=Amycolatopsis sp. NPDC004079 TaxID=3154549 RepID=UPI0033AE205D